MLSEDLFADLFPHLRSCTCLIFVSPCAHSLNLFIRSRRQRRSIAESSRRPPRRHCPLGTQSFPRVHRLDHTSRHQVLRPRTLHGPILAVLSCAAVLCHQPEAARAFEAIQPQQIRDRDSDLGRLGHRAGQSVFVSLEGDLTRRLENGEGTFFLEHPTTGTGKGAATSSSPEDRLTAALRVALSTLKVVHTGDLFPLPLAPHPVTHVPPNPGKVTLCEPVSQGILSPTTRIILSRGRIHSQRNRDAVPIASTRTLNGVAEDDEDTANDQFYSAAEERYRTDVANRRRRVRHGA